MHALQFAEFGGPEVLRWAPAPEPHAGPGEVRVEVLGASINPVDWKSAAGFMSGGRPLTGPGYLGRDGAGVVDEVGAGVVDVQVGDLVWGLGSATQAEHAVLRSWVPVPDGVDPHVAAAAGVAVETSERGLRLLSAAPGQTLFVDGGSGGVGAVLVQLAVARGIRVIASAGPANQERLRAIGATPVVYGDGLAERVRAAAGGGVDVVFDVAGKTDVGVLLGLVATPHQVLSIANFAAADTGIQVSGGGGQSRPADALAEGNRLLASGALTIEVQRFPFAEAVQAYELSLTGHVRGKLVLTP